MNDYEKQIQELTLELEKAKKELSLYNDVMNKTQDGFFAVDKNGTIILYSEGIANAEGLSIEEVIGKTEAEIFSDPTYDFYDTVERTVIDEQKPILEQRFIYKTPNGVTHNIVFSTFPWCYQGEILGAYTIGRDVNQINSFLNAQLSYERQLKNNNKQHEDAYYFLHNIIGSSPQIKDCVAQAEKIAYFDIPVMIIGETGSGKELFAQGIHNAGNSRRGPFISVNCAALPETLLESILFGTSKGAFTGAVDMAGLFEQAADGSLFLDEINSMPFTLQNKLLRALQEKRGRRLGGKNEYPITCRIISATNEDPFLAEKSFIRTDLLYRLSTSVIKVPPLRHRKEDIPELCHHFLRTSKCKKSIYLWNISQFLLEIFYHYDWPGNVRELKNVITSSIIFAEPQEQILRPEHIPMHLKEIICNSSKDYLTISGCTLKEMISDYEKRTIIDTIFRTKGNISKSAKILGITRQNLYFKIHKYGIEQQIINPNTDKM